MGKVGKRTRKFSKRHLPKVLKQRRKFKSITKRNALKARKYLQEGHNEVEPTELSNGSFDNEDIGDVSLDVIFNDDVSEVEDNSDSDGFLSEDSCCRFISNGKNKCLFEDSSVTAVSKKNKKIHEKLLNLKQELTNLKERDPGFSAFLENHSGSEISMECGSDGDHCEKGTILETGLNRDMLSIERLSELAFSQHDVSAMVKLFNLYRVACNFGNKSVAKYDSWIFSKASNSEALSNIVFLMLTKADGMFRAVFGLSANNFKKDFFKSNPKFERFAPLIKSYLKSTVIILEQLSDTEMLTFILTQLRNSIIFFAPFTYLTRRLIKVAVHLWATSEGELSLTSHSILHDIASNSTLDSLNICISTTFKTFFRHCIILERSNLMHYCFIRDSTVELLSLDIKKSTHMAFLWLQQQEKSLRIEMDNGKKERIENICNWPNVCCIDLWVMYISTNISEYDLQPLLLLAVHFINGVLCCFPGPRYVPLKFRCIRWLNSLSRSSGVFIPILSLALDPIQYCMGKESQHLGKVPNFSSCIKLPGNCLEYKDFQEESSLCIIELLVEHFSQWSFHISFPDLATIPLSALRRFHDNVSTESVRKNIKRLIDQVEKNVSYIEQKRNEVAFSPRDGQSVASFLQLEKGVDKFPFSQYYKSILSKAASRIYSSH